MIKYSLRCANEHHFEAWFRSSEAFERQVRRKAVTCPRCGDSGIERQPMAPAILKTTSTPLREAAGSSVETLRKIKKYIIANTEDVGADFAREARKIHEGEVAERPIRGQATDAEAQSLTEDGIAFGVLPPLPEDHN